VQQLTTDILSLLVRLLAADAFILLGVTMADLYPDASWNFVSARRRREIESASTGVPFGEPAQGVVCRAVSIDSGR